MLLLTTMQAKFSKFSPGLSEEFTVGLFTISFPFGGAELAF